MKRVACLKITVEIDQNPHLGILLTPRDSKLPRPVQSLKDVKHEEVVEEMPICIGYVPKAFMEAVERGNVCQARLIEADEIQPAPGFAGVNGDNAVDPTSANEVLKDAFQRVIIKWTLKFRFHSRICGLVDGSDMIR